MLPNVSESAPAASPLQRSSKNGLRARKHAIRVAGCSRWLQSAHIKCPVRRNSGEFRWLDRWVLVRG